MIVLLQPVFLISSASACLGPYAKGQVLEDFFPRVLSYPYSGCYHGSHPSPPMSLAGDTSGTSMAIADDLGLSITERRMSHLLPINGVPVTSVARYEV